LPIEKQLQRPKLIGKENLTHNSLQAEDREVKNGQVFFQVDESMRIFP